MRSLCQLGCGDRTVTAPLILEVTLSTSQFKNELQLQAVQFAMKRLDYEEYDVGDVIPQ